MLTRHIAGAPVSALGLGCMGMSMAYGPADDAESTRVLHRALDLGVNHFDTSDAYGAGANERLLGPVVRARRDEVFLATKFGIRLPDGASHSAVPGTRVDSGPSWAAAACDASLGRLGIETIDLYYLHRRDPATPIEETVGAMAALVAAGKVRHIGLSEVSPATLRAAHAVHPVAAVQMEYSLFSREVEDEMLAVCRELGVTLVAYSPVGRGMLTGTITGTDQLQREGDYRANGAPRFSAEALPTNLALAGEVREVAAEIGCTPAQAALAWVLAQGEEVVAIPGTKRVRYLEENTAAADLALTPEQVSRLSAAVPRAAVAGARYAEAAMRFVGH
ncbi:aldo/keto reductase [Phytohabitans sp. ZYX-F-186]|uniref:Aldo/keto reductase n=1 Tax=Phytohabitans maris TaxID=3071409 RepID=A0ABU0ZBZ8_9ACTN|nr:aldo/keto reductase [Phytohabitans sp. ZYX-F-186]MDQ7904570.1 aldo/keto reductase [Phytohabitans sp. ZYX-F-186]